MLTDTYLTLCGMGSSMHDAEEGLHIKEPLERWNNTGHLL